MITTELRLNAKSEMVKPYDPFYGKVIEQMPLLIADGREPLSTAGLAERRVKVYAPEDVNVAKNWKNNSFFTGDVVVYNAQGEAELVLDSADLRAVTPKSILTLNGALILSDKAWKRLKEKKVMSLSSNDLRELNGKGYTRETAKQSEVWRFWLRSKRLHQKYVDVVADETQSEKIMRMYFDLGKYNSPVLRPWVVDGVDLNLSDADGANSLDDDLGRLVGYVSEPSLASSGKSGGGAFRKGSHERSDSTAQFDGCEAPRQKEGVSAQKLADALFKQLGTRTFSQGMPSRRDLQRIIAESL